MKTFSQKNWPIEDEKAVAYQLNFVPIAYGYGNETHKDYFRSCCENTKSQFVHYKDFEFPKSKTILKPYFQLDCFFYAISEELKNAILEFGIDDKEDAVFRPVWTKKHDHPLCYSIEPKHIIKPIAKENNYDTEVICKTHNVTWAYRKKDDFSYREYNGVGRPLYVSEDVLNDFHDFNYTYEYFGPGGYLLRKVIVSKRVSDFIISLHPRAEFRPVLIKEVSIETEEMRQKRLRTLRLNEWRQSRNQSGDRQSGDG